MSNRKRRPGALVLMTAWAACGVCLAAPTEQLVTDRPWQAWSPDGGLPAVRAPAPPLTEMPAGPLGLAALTDLALLNHPATREAWAAARAEAAGVGLAQAPFLPELAATVPLDYSRGSRSGGTRSTETNGDAGSRTRFSPAFSLTYVLLDFGARASELEAARYATLAANLSQNRALQDVMLQVEQAYYQFLGAQELIAALRETERNAQASLDAASERRRAGVATVADVYQAETVLAQARLELRRAEGQAAAFRGALANAAALPVDAPFEVALPVQEVPDAETLGGIEGLLATARARRPDLVAAEAQARAGRARIGAAAAQGLPTLELSASVGSSFTGSDFGGNSGNLMLNMRIPLFDGGRSLHLVRQAEARAEQLEAARDRIGRQVELDVWQAYYDARTAHATIDSAGVLLRSASQSLDAARARYQAGVGTLLDVLNAQAAEANARVELIRARLGWYSSLSRLNNAMGTILPSLSGSQRP